MRDLATLAVETGIAIYAALILIRAASSNDTVSLVAGFVAFYGLMGLILCVHYTLKSVPIVSVSTALMAAGVIVLRIRNPQPLGPGAPK